MVTQRLVLPPRSHKVVVLVPALGVNVLPMSVWVPQLPDTVQKHACEVNWKLRSKTCLEPSENAQCCNWRTV